MLYKLVFFCDKPQANEGRWRALDLAVKADLAEYREGLQGDQLRTSLMAVPLAEGEEIEARIARLPRVQVTDWMALYLLEPAYHINASRCLPGATLLFVSEGQEHIARDYRAQHVPCLALLPGKRGRWFPRLSPLSEPEATLFMQPETEDDRWQPWEPKG